MSRLPKSREVVYIAGAYTAPDTRGIAANCNSAHALARRVRAFGLVPFVPHTAMGGGETLGFLYDPLYKVPRLTWEEAMVECREFVQRCDAVLMVEGWERSRGATEERELAKACGIPVFGSFAELVAARLAVKAAEAPAVQQADGAP